MGRQDGIAPIKGKVGTFSFYKNSEDGYLARKKGGVDSKRIKNDPAYERTRQHGAEFGRAGKASKLLRDSIRSLLVTTADNRVTSRLTQAMLKVVKSDPISNRGARTAAKGDLTHVKNFEFNNNMPLKSKFFAQYEVAFERATGAVQLTIQELNISTHVSAPAGATHFKLSLAATELDFAEEHYIVKELTTEAIALNGGKLALAPMMVNLTPNSSKPVIIVLGIEFGDYFKDTYTPYKDSSQNALRIVKIDVPA